MLLEQLLLGLRLGLLLGLGLLPEVELVLLVLVRQVLVAVVAVVVAAGVWRCVGHGAGACVVHRRCRHCLTTRSSSIAALYALMPLCWLLLRRVLQLCWQLLPRVVLLPAVRCQTAFAWGAGMSHSSSLCVCGTLLLLCTAATCIPALHASSAVPRNSFGTWTSRA